MVVAPESLASLNEEQLRELDSNSGATTIDAKMIAREKIKESNRGDDSALTNARPGQSQHQGIELWSAPTEPISCAPDRPDKVALVQPSGGKPDTDAVMHQYLHTVGASVGKKVSGVRVGGAKDLTTRARAVSVTAPAVCVFLEPAVQDIGVHALAAGQCCDGSTRLLAGCHQLGFEFGSVGSVGAPSRTSGYL